MAKLRLAIVASHVIQHFAPVYKKLGESSDIDIKVFFVAENGAASYPDPGFGEEVKWDLELTSGYAFKFVEPGKVVKKFGLFAIDSKKLVPAIKEYSPDYVWINGYATLANWRVLFSQSEKVKFIYGSDSNLSDSRSSLVRLLKKPIVSFFLKRCHHFLSVSPANRKYLEFYGVDPRNVTESKYPVDIARFQLQRKELSSIQIDRLRQDLAIPDGTRVLIFAGKLIAHKRPQDVLQAMLEPGIDKVHVVLLGSGDMLPALRTQAKNLNIENRVHFVGFVNQSQLAKYFELADILLFPSAKEPYGAIAAETLPFGLPIIATDVVGAIGSSILPDINALLFPVADVQRLGQQIRRLLEDDDLRKEFSRNSRQLAAGYDKSPMARDIIDICLQR